MVCLTGNFRLQQLYARFSAIDSISNCCLIIHLFLTINSFRSVRCCFFLSLSLWRDQIGWFVKISLCVCLCVLFCGRVHCFDIVEGECFPLILSDTNRYRRRPQKSNNNSYMCNQTVCALCVCVDDPFKSERRKKTRFLCSFSPHV